MERLWSVLLEYVAVRVVGIGYPHRLYPAVPFITIFNSFSFFTVYLHVDVHRLNELHSCALPCSNSDKYEGPERCPNWERIGRIFEERKFKGSTTTLSVLVRRT